MQLRRQARINPHRIYMRPKTGKAEEELLHETADSGKEVIGSRGQLYGSKLRELEIRLTQKWLIAAKQVSVRRATGHADRGCGDGVNRVRHRRPVDIGARCIEVEIV